MNAPVASLRIDLGFDTSELIENAADARSAFASFAEEVGKKFRELEQTIRRVGIGLTAGISAPFAALTVVSARGASSFESAMNRVEAALRGVSAEQLERLSQAARTLGPEVGLSAVEAADGIETLALTGMSAETTLRGGLQSTLRLAAANLGEVSDAAALTSDIMRQFVITSGDLPDVVNQVTGAIDASKLSFSDYLQAVAQAGGVAASAGVSFEDFNAALAATAPLFQSGSDAGTSFKTFITSLSPQSNEARDVMKQLGLSFFDASGRMKSLADIAEELRNALDGLSERSRTEALRTIFGTDAMRTAIGLMQQGRQGILDLQAAIDRTDAGDKLAIQMRGAEAASNRLGAALERIKIALGSAGLLAALTVATQGLTALANAFANLPPGVHTAILVIWGLAAAIGPLTLAVLAIARIALPLFITRLGLVGLGLVALINPIGAAAGLFLNLAIRFTGAASALSLFAGTLLRVLGPLGLVVSGLVLLYSFSGQTTQATEQLSQSAERARGALAEQREATLALATATGEARNALIAKMRADRAAAASALATARADMIAANAALARANAARANADMLNPAGDRPSPIGLTRSGTRADEAQSNADLRATMETVEKLTETIVGYNQALNSLNTTPTVDMNFGGDDDSTKKSRDRDLARRREEIRLQQMLDVATARGDIEEQRRIEQLIELERRFNDYKDAGLSADQARVAAQRDMGELQSARLIGLQRERDLETTRVDLEAARIAGERDFVRDLENRLYITERIAYWRRQELTVQEAQVRAEGELAQLENARAERRRREAADAERQRQLDLSRLRGDSEREIRARTRAVELERRAQEIADREEIGLTDAPDRATIELGEEERARLQGDFRSTFRDGVRAALDGDFGSWFERWWTDRLTRSLEDALNNVADLLMDLIGGAGKGGGGGLLGSILGGIGSLFGGGGGGASLPFSSGTNGAWFGGFTGSLPGLAGGGSITVGGPPGLDKSLLSLNGAPIARVNRGETIGVSPGGGRDEIHVYVHPSPELDVRVERVSNRAIAAAAPRIAREGAGMAIRTLTTPSL